MKPGFMIITSVNKASSAGRANFSSAIKHRCTNIFAPPLKQYKVEDFVEIIVNWAEKDPSIQAPNLRLIKTIAQKFHQLVQQDSKYNLRSLKNKFNEIKDKLGSINPQYTTQTQLSNPSLNLLSFSNQPNLKFFSSSTEIGENKLDLNRWQQNNFHFRHINQGSLDPRGNIFKALQAAKDKSGISDDDMIQFSILAVKHQGLGNVFNSQQNDQIEQDFKRLFGEQNWQEKKSQAIKFSSAFQRSLIRDKIYTGRQYQFRKVGMRLKRLDPELLLEFLIKDQRSAVKKEFIKDNFVNKLNKILRNSKIRFDFEESIKELMFSKGSSQGRY